MEGDEGGERQRGEGYRGETAQEGEGGLLSIGSWAP
jgi:hypothetical protein